MANTVIKYESLLVAIYESDLSVSDRAHVLYALACLLDEVGMARCANDCRNPKPMILRKAIKEAVKRNGPGKRWAGVCACGCRRPIPMPTIPKYRRGHNIQKRKRDGRGRVTSPATLL